MFEGNIEICCSEMTKHSPMKFLKCIKIAKMYRSTLYWLKFQNMNFPLFHDVGKIEKSSVDQYSKIPMFNLCKFGKNWKCSRRPNSLNQYSKTQIRI